MALNTGRILKKDQLTEDIFELTITPSSPFDFHAGQFITIKINDKNPTPCFRAYSISSAPNKELKTFELCIKVIQNGRGSNWLNSLKENDIIEFLGPNGKFTFQRPRDKKSLFIATGTGVAPLKSIIEDLLNKNIDQELHLIWGLRHIKDIFYREHFENLSQKYQNFKYNITLSQPENENWKGNKGRVTAFLENLSIKPEKTEAYLCGLKVMIDEVNKILKEKGMKKNNIYFEKYD